MNQRSDIDRLLTAWLSEGPTSMPDRIVDVVADRISGQRQRRPWRFLRRLPMNPLFKLGVAAAAVLAVALVGYNLLPGSSGPGGDPSQSPSPTATSAPTSTPTAAAPPQIRLRPFASAPTLFIDATVPAGWGSAVSWAILAPDGAKPPGGLGIALLRADGLFRDPCHWDIDGTGTESQPGDLAVGPTVDDLVTALRANSAYASSTPTAVTIGGYAGLQLNIQLPSDIDFGACEKVTGETTGSYYLFSGLEGGLYAQGAGNRWEVSVLDIEGTRIILVVNDYAGTPPAVRAAAQSIVDSLVINP